MNERGGGMEGQEESKWRRNGKEGDNKGEGELKGRRTENERYRAGSGSGKEMCLKLTFSTGWSDCSWSFF